MLLATVALWTPALELNTVPAQALVAGVHPLLVLLSCGLGVGAIGIVAFVWRSALRRYTSATS